MMAGDSFFSEKREISLLLCKLPIFGSWEEKGNDLGIEVFKTRNSARSCLLFVVFTFFVEILVAKFKFFLSNKDFSFSGSSPHCGNALKQTHRL